MAIDKRKHVAIRVMSNVGRYPNYDIHLSDNLFRATPELTFSAVVASSADRGDSELFWLSPAEIRLFSAITLSIKEPWSHGRFIIAPRTYPVAVPFDLRLFDTEEGVRILAKNARRVAREVDQGRGTIPDWPGPCDLAEGGSPEEIARLLAAIDIEDALLIRGLSKFVSANHLLRYGATFEDGGTAAMIALEAALELLRRRLSVDLGKTVSYAELFEDLEGASPDGWELVQGFREVYDTRILLVHPNSRFGPFWVPPIQADDCYGAVNMGTYVFRRILLGEV